MVTLLRSSSPPLAKFFTRLEVTTEVTVSLTTLLVDVGILSSKFAGFVNVGLVGVEMEGFSILR